MFVFESWMNLVPNSVQIGIKFKQNYLLNLYETRSGHLIDICIVICHLIDRWLTG